MIWAHVGLFSPILFAILITFNLQQLSLEETSHHKLCGVSEFFTRYRVQAFSCSSLGKKRKKNLLLKTYWVKKTRGEIITPYGPWNVRVSGGSVRLQRKSEAELLQSLPQAWAGWCDGRKFADSLRRLILWCSSEAWVFNSIPSPFQSHRLHKIKALSNSKTLDWSGEIQPAIVSVVNSHRRHRRQNGSLKKMWWWG